jgi:phosphoenolpyruvate---glycerone phosphotransferase subunit DhaL
MVCLQIRLHSKEDNEVYKSKLTSHEAKDMFSYVSRKMVESKDVLTQADKAIGDGDHGIGMARGFEAVQRNLENQSYKTIGDLLKSIGTTLLTSIGGAAGAIFGTFFRGGAKNLSAKDDFDSIAFSLMLRDGLEAVKERGKAKAGDKTMIDALEPAGLKASELVSAPLYEALQSAAGASRDGMEKTKEMIATTGKAKTLGERSLGYADPGSISTYLILNFMFQFVEGCGAPIGEVGDTSLR